MTSKERARMNDLCAQIQSEKDFSKFQQLTREVTSLISAKQNRFPESRFAPAGTGQKLVQATATRTVSGFESGADFVEIRLAGAQPLFAEIRVENSFTDDHGNRLALQTPAPVDVKLQANAQHFTLKP